MLPVRLLLVSLVLTFTAAAQRTAPPPPTFRSTFLSLPGTPDGIAVSSDGNWLFVALSSPPAVAVVKRQGNGAELQRVISLDQAPTGVVLTHDQQLLIVAAGPLVYIMDVARIEVSTALPLDGEFSDGPNPGSVYVNVTADDHWLFVADENVQQITVVDLAATRASGFTTYKTVGKIPVGTAPTDIQFSPDGQFLYSTIEIVPLSPSWPLACIQEGQTANQTLVNPQGALAVVSVALATSDPAHSVVGGAPAGCSPVRMALSAAGDRLYVTARNSNAVLAFETSRLVSDPTHALLGSVAVGTSPVPVAIIDWGHLVIAGNSDRFEAVPTPQTLNLLDPLQLERGGSAVIGTLPTGAFPREMAHSPDGRTLYISDYSSNQLQILEMIPGAVPRR